MAIPFEQGLRTWLAEQFPTARVVTETPANLAAALPCIQVGRIGGGDEEFAIFDNPTMDVDTFAATREDARNLADQIRVRMRTALEGQNLGGSLVLRVRTTSSPSWAPYDNTAMRRFVATYSLRIQQR